MPYLDRAGTRIYYQVTGDPGGHPPLLLSHGFGASSAMWEPFAQEWPERVAGLVLCDTGPGFRSDQARGQWNERAVATAARLERDGLAALRGAPGEPDYGHRSARGLALASRGMLAQQDGRVIEGLASVKVPVLVLVGARDEAFLPAAGYLTAKIPGAVQVVVPDAGHVSNVDQPGQFNQSVLAFLSQLR
jgi:pimeloyl-ACP methyl ester carboxylesterase